MKNMLILLVAVFSFVTAYAQEKKDKAKEEPPKGTWKVNKKFDEDGNLIKYDSIYSYSYTTKNGNYTNVNIDSIMKAFRSRTNHDFPWHDNFNFFPRRDSLLMDKFFNRDYFLENWDKRNEEIEKMLKRIDSSRNKYLQEFFPGLLESKKSKENKTI